MAYVAALGVLYDIPTTNDSTFIPSMRVRADVPVAQMAHDAIDASWPEVTQRVYGLAPSAANAAWPGIQPLVPLMVDAAWPIVMSKIPDVVAAMKPHVADIAPAAWEAMRPLMVADVRTAIAAQRTNAAIVGGLIAASALVVGFFAAKKSGWLPQVSRRWAT